VRVLFHPSAAAELAEAIEWYEAQSRGLGARLLRSVEKAIAAIRECPSTWPIWPGLGEETGIRRFLLPRFPFGIAYRQRAGVVEVVAFAHLKRRPGYWRDR
jgi:hypothetical protein